MRIETVAEELVCAGAIALADGAGGIVEGPAGYGDAKWDEGFFFETAGEFLPAVLIIEISGAWSAEDSLRRINVKLTRRCRKRKGEVRQTFGIRLVQNQKE